MMAKSTINRKGHLHARFQAPAPRAVLKRVPEFCHHEQKSALSPASRTELLRFKTSAWGRQITQKNVEFWKLKSGKVQSVWEQRNCTEECRKMPSIKDCPNTCDAGWDLRSLGGDLLFLNYKKDNPGNQMVEPEHQTPNSPPPGKQRRNLSWVAPYTSIRFMAVRRCFALPRAPKKKDCAHIPAWEILAALYGTALSSEQQKDIGWGNKAKVAVAFVLLMHGGDKRKERGNSKVLECGKLVPGKVDIAESPKHLPSFSSHKQSKGYHPRVRNMLPAEKERKVLNWLFLLLKSRQNGSFLLLEVFETIKRWQGLGSVRL